MRARSSLVLADVDRADVAARYGLGDLVGYAPWPNEVIERLRAERIPVVMGNYDDGTGFDRDECGCVYVDPTEEALGDQSFEWTKAHTSADNKAWLRTLAPAARAIEASDLPDEFAAQLREAGGYRAQVRA